ncbi:MULTISPECIES: hypothetical protein [Rhodanobacter]|uniref:Uncharacterized protein n=1 Tax=Rhodanobacter denitrificans TaxID=666685 RepID=I4WGY7_9GAMM|nr:MULTISPECIES: hypothetical protein [Rhodanobacter]AGG90926.1 hypothetical protein R2APBS1_3875 [Rhodanobacter denitrificans]EIL98728.1 hypothetical protein UUC_16995 [Rhodanobacter denitrificans]KZC21549.1 hypothetical protein RHOFW104R3_01830 [Rhodanobacter denitrificans]UJM86295.1 hypothetical protein LRJ86_16170 [Rhodanobacter denitrificans]UJM90234.1 hypothetical protein LRK24_17695 [Rhodanobacter denitrificans]
MPLRLVDDDLDLSLDIAMSWSSREALGIQLERCLSTGTNAPFESRLITSLASILDDDLQPPTQSQVSYALSIAKALAISLPGEALKYKGTMKQFLSRYAPVFREHRWKYSTSAQVQQS